MSVLFVESDISNQILPGEFHVWWKSTLKAFPAQAEDQATLNRVSVQFL